MNCSATRAMTSQIARSVKSVAVASRQPLARRASAPGDSDLLDRYMREVCRVPLLSEREERDLSERYRQSRDPTLARQLAAANLRLVVRIAREYHRPPHRLLDLIQEGNVGLLKAVEKYDPDRGSRLASYASWWIRAYVLRHVMQNHRLVRLGTSQVERRLFFNLRKAERELGQLGVTPDADAVARRLGVARSAVESMTQRMAAHETSLDAPRAHDGAEAGGLVERLAGRDAERPDVATERAEFRSILRRNLDEFRSTLGGRDLVIFRERMYAEEPRALTDLGKGFGVTRERVRQIEQRIVGKLHVFLSQRQMSAQA